MYGLDAIKAGSGWEITAVGIFIVFTGLTFLSLFINQIHKLLDLWENRREIKLFQKKDKTRIAINFSESQKIMAKQIFLLAKTMDASFSLPRLLMLAEMSGIANPHSSVCLLLNTGILLPDHKGFYFWDRDKFVSMTS